MKRSGIVVGVVAFAAVAAAGGKPSNARPEEARPEVVKLVAAASEKPHPRLFADVAGFEAVGRRAKTDPTVRAGVEHVCAVADVILSAPPSRYSKDASAKRILHVSRRVLHRLTHLGLAYRLTGKREYARRGAEEMLAACAFPDWNPSHFLDTAEMSLAVAIGYDWLWEALDRETRAKVILGLTKHGIRAGEARAGWIRARNNWGQVCHAGMLAAALATAEEDPARAARFVQRAVDCLPISMRAIAPRGGYPEGPVYWSYGIEFNVVAIALLESALGTDFGLSARPGFLQTADYLEIVTGPSGRAFNYADGGDFRGTCFATWYFASRLNRPDLLRFERRAFGQYAAQRDKALANRGNRLFPLALFWAKTPPENAEVRIPLVWNSQGSVPITVQRSSWDDRSSLFVGLKAGSPSAPHGHMDGGSFVLDAHGVRWALDLGPEDYARIEAMKISLWDFAQGSGRWSIYRLNTASHNTLMLDGAPQNVRGAAFVTKVTGEPNGPESEVVLDLTKLYPAAKRVTRTGRMAADGRRYALADRIEGFRPGGVVRWSMLTRAQARPETDGRRLVLEQQGKRIVLEASGTGVTPWKVGAAECPGRGNSSNPGVSQLTFEAHADAQGSAQLEVVFAI